MRLRRVDGRSSTAATIGIRRDVELLLDLAGRRGQFQFVGLMQVAPALQRANALAGRARRRNDALASGFRPVMMAKHSASKRKATDPPIFVYYQLVDGPNNPIAHSGQTVELYVVIERHDAVVDQLRVSHTRILRNALIGMICVCVKSDRIIYPDIL